MSDERITGVAIRWGEVTFSDAAPARHGDLIGRLHRNGLTNACHGDQGVLTNTDRFVTRAEGHRIAVAAGQFKRRDTSFQTEELYSEDVW